MPGPLAKPGMWQVAVRRVGPKAFEQELLIRTEGASKPTADVMSICLVQLGEALPPDAVPELSDVKATTHLDDTEGVTVRVAGSATSYHEPPRVTRFAAW